MTSPIRTPLDPRGRDFRLEALTLLRADPPQNFRSLPVPERAQIAVQAQKNRAELIPVLLPQLREHLPQLKALAGRGWSDDAFYRFYHQSFKIFGRQPWLGECVVTFASIFPGVALNSRYREIAEAGLAEHFQPSFNEEWSKHARPVVEAIAHTNQFLTALVRAAESDAKDVPQTLTPAWGLVLYLWNLR